MGEIKTPGIVGSFSVCRSNENFQHTFKRLFKFLWKRF